MGCSESADSKKPMLILDYENANQTQKAYLEKLIQNFTSEKKVGYKLADLNNKFCVKLHYNNQDFLIQEVFEDTNEKMKESLDKVYNLLKQSMRLRPEVVLPNRK